MIERRAVERIQINQPAMLHLDGVRGVYPCMVMISTIREPGYIPPRFTVWLLSLICHSMVSKRQSTAMWCGGTEIRAAWNLSIEAMPERRAEAAGARGRRAVAARRSPTAMRRS